MLVSIKDENSNFDKAMEYLQAQDGIIVEEVTENG